MIWTEFWHGKDNNIGYKPIFKQRKNNLPHKYASPQGLIDFLAAIKSELLDPKNRNKVHCNLPEEEIKALHTLIQLQKERKIIMVLEI